MKTIQDLYENAQNFITSAWREDSKKVTCTVGLKLKRNTDNTIVINIAMDVEYTCIKGIILHFILHLNDTSEEACLKEVSSYKHNQQTFKDNSTGTWYEKKSIKILK